MVLLAHGVAVSGGGPKFNQNQSKTTEHQNQIPKN